MADQTPSDFDVAVRLVLPSSLPDSANHTTSRSKILRARSEFFASRLSDRWSSNCSSDECETVEIVMYDCAAAEAYIRCIKLMAVPKQELLRVLCRCFRSVNDGLALLHVATELLFEDCISACLQYLEMFPTWKDTEQASIGSALSSLQIPSRLRNADLEARLALPLPHVSVENPVLIMRRMLVHVLREAYKVMDGIKHCFPPTSLNMEASQPVLESDILHVWNSNLNVVKEMLARNREPDRLRDRDRDALKRGTFLHFMTELSWDDAMSAASALSWMLTQLSILQVAEYVVRPFATDTQLSSLVRDAMKTASKENDGRHGNSRQLLSEHLVGLVTSMADLLSRGLVLLPRASRLSFISIWLPVIRTLHPSGNGHLHALFHHLINSLPYSDRDKFFGTFKAEPDFKGFLQTSNSAYTLWCASLWQSNFSHMQEDEGFSTSLQLVVSNNRRY